MRRLWIGLLALGACLLLLLAAGWLLRLPLAGWAVARALQAGGIAGSATVTHLDAAAVELRDIRLDGQQAARLRVSYDLRDLLRDGRVAAVEVAGLRLTGDLTAAQPFGELPAQLAELSGGAAGDPAAMVLPVLPSLTLTDIQLALLTARGPLALRLDGRLAATGPDGSQPLDLTLQSLDGPLALTGRATGRYRPGTGDGSALALDLRSRTGPPVALKIDAGIAAGNLAVTAALSGDAAVLAALAALPVPLQPTAGQLALQAGARLPAAPLLAGRAPLLADASGLQAFDLTLALTGLDLPGRVSGLSLNTGIDLDTSGLAGARTLLLRSGEARLGGIDPAWLAALGLPPAAAQSLAQGGVLSLQSRGMAPAGLVLAGAVPPRLDLALAAGLDLTAGGRLDLDLAGGLVLPAGFPGTAARPIGHLTGSLAAEALALPGLASLDRARAPFALTLDAGSAALALTGPLTVQGILLAPALSADADVQDWQALRGQPADLALDPAGTARTRLDLSGDRPVLTLPQEIRLTAGTAELEALLDGRLVLAAAGLPDTADVTLQTLTLRELPTPHGLLRSLTLAGRVSGAPRALTGDLQATISLQQVAAGALRADAVQASLAADLAWDDRALRLHLNAPGSLVAAAFAGSPGLVVDRLELGLATAELEVNLDRTGTALHLSADAALSPARFDLDGDGKAGDLEVSAGQLLLDLTLSETGALRGTAGAAALQASHRGAAVAMRDGRLSATIDGRIGKLTLDGARIQSTAVPPAFPVLTVTGSGALDDNVATYRAAIRALDGAISATLTGRQDFAQDRGTAALRLAPLTFAAGGLQPAALNPALASLENASGSLAAEADLKLGSRLDGTARLTLKDIGFTAAGSRVEGLNLDLALSALNPPRSPPGQPFSIARIDAGVALTDLQGRLRLQPGRGGSELVIEQAAAAFLDGRLALADAVIDPLAARYDLDLQFERVDLARLLALAGLQEVSGSGLLSGRIPVTVAGDAITVRDGRLDALSPGRLTFRSAAARDALASGGESVDLMLTALEDFHYQVLGLSLDKPATGESRMLLRLEGSNPAVLDGQPFVLNINLVSNIAPLLAALARGTELSSRLVQQILQDMAR